MFSMISALPAVLKVRTSGGRVGAMRRRSRQTRPGAERLEGRALLAAPYLGYALDLGGTIQTLGYGVATDASGDAVTTGSFYGTTNFDPNNPSDTAATLSTPISGYNSNGDPIYASNAYVARYGPSGNLLWVHAFGDLNGASGTRVAIDSAGDIDAVGTFSGTVNVGTDALGNAVSLTAPGTSEFYLVKYAPDGTVLWAEVVGGGGNVNTFAVDGAGNAYLSAYFTGSTTVGDQTLSYTNGNNYLTKIDPDGNVLWVDQFQFGAGVNGLAFDNSGNIYMAGSFDGSADFNPGPGTYTLYSGGRSVEPSFAAYVEKLTPSGGFVWADAFQATQWSYSNAEAVALDAGGNVYVAGAYNGTVDFNPASKTKYSLTTSGKNNEAAYVEKLTPAGMFSWVQSMGGSGSAGILGMALDGSGSIDLVGHYTGTIDFDPGAGAYNLTAPSSNTTFVVQLTASGGFAWVTGQTSVNSLGLALDASGDLFITGYFTGTVNFAPNGSQTLTSQGLLENAFLWELKPNP